MADPQRLAVDKLVLHHAVTPLWSDKSKAWLAQWFSDNGFARGYGSNAANWSGLINPYTGGRSYAMAQFAGQRVDNTTPDASDAERAAGYRLVQLVADPWGQICWHAGNWAVNQSSIGIENLGDYRNYTLRDGDDKVIADFWRPQDQAFGGNTAVYGHTEVTLTSTECPARIMEQRDNIVNYINNPPAAPAPPVVTPPANTTPDIKVEDITNKTVVVTKDGGAELWDLTFSTYGAAHSVKHFNKGDKIDVSAIATHPLGSKYYLTEYSFTKNIMNGINVADVADYTPTTPPVTEPPVTTPPVTPPVESDKDKEQDQRLTLLEAAVKALQDGLAAIVDFFKNLKVGK